MVVSRGNVQQYLYHLHDGPEQEERDRKMQMVPTPPGEALAWRDPGLAPKLLGYDHIADVSVSHDAYRFHLTCPLVIFSKACSVKFRLVFGNWY